MAYRCLDVLVCNFRTHLFAQWDAIHAKLGQLFKINPPLKPSTIKKVHARAYKLCKTKVEEVVEGGKGCNKAK